MRKTIIRLFTLCLFTALATAASVRGFAQDKSTEPKFEASKAAKKKSDESRAKEPRAKQMPFQGKLGAVDKVNKTITIKGKEKDRTFHVTSNTKLSKDGKPAVLDDAMVGDEVAGLVRKNADGKVEALLVCFGAKARDQAKPKQEKPEKSEK